MLLVELDLGLSLQRRHHKGKGGGRVGGLGDRQESKTGEEQLVGVGSGRAVQSVDLGGQGHLKRVLGLW